jgi:hypothetical protein
MLDGGAACGEPPVPAQYPLSLSKTVYELSVPSDARLDPETVALGGKLCRRSEWRA